MSTLDGLIFGIKDIINKLGVTQPTSTKLRFMDGAVVYNEGTKALEYTPPSAPPVNYPFGPAAKLTTPPDIASFTLRNPVGGGVGTASLATIQNHPSGYGFAIYGTQNSQHECFCGAMKTRGANTTLIAQIDAPYWDASPDGVINAPPFGGIFIYSPATGRAIIFGPYSGTIVGSSAIYVFHQDIAGAGTTAACSFVPGRSPFPLWLKWHDDGANYNYSYSFDGEFTHAPTFVESRTAWLSDAGTEVGIGANANQASGTRTNKTSFSLWCGSFSLT